MILRSIFLKIGDEEEQSLPEGLSYTFLNRSRFVCNYIEREVLSKIRFKTKDFGRIVIALGPQIQKTGKEVFINSEQIAVLEIPFNRKEYASKSGKGLALYFIDKLKEGLDKCAKSVKIPKKEIFKGLDAFTTEGFKNEWVFKKRVFRKEGLQAFLECELTQNDFILRLKVFRTSKLVFDKVIYKTFPYQVAMSYPFRDMAIEGHYLVVTNRLKGEKPLHRVLISKLSK
jgi:hypothetical protein